MKNKFLNLLLILLLILLCSLCLAACGSSEEISTEPSEDVVEETKEEAVPIERDEEAILESKEEQDRKDEVIYICYSEDAMTFITDEVETYAVEAEVILKELCRRNAMSESVKVLDLSVDEVEGKKTISLDLNAAFQQYLSTIGSTGEYYVLGGFCNSFLQSYDCEQIKVTVNGSVLSTGHNEYSGYMTLFE